ncbi:MAG: tetratricopeptide repeat protein, partial [Acidobacteriaceae bacterium]|nr:tetratricopeptide repeat protein [Acidobacteriaceae bacterium]
MQLLLAISVVGVTIVSSEAQSVASASDAWVQQLHEEAQAAERRGDLDTAIDKYEALIRSAPEIAAAYNNLGALYFKRREYAKAADVLRRGLKMNPEMPSATALLGMALFEEGDVKNARAPLEAALQSNPKDNNIELFLVNDLTRLGEFEAAAAHLEQLKTRAPNNQQVWYLLANVYTQLAQQALAKMNSLDPNSVWAHEITGEIMENMKNYPAALAEYKKAVEAAPRQPGTHYKLGDLYWSLYRWDEATHEFEAELSNDPGNCMAQWKIGDTLLQQSKDPEQALTDITKALSACPNLTEARFDRGRALLRLHRYEEAIADLQAAEQTNPNEPTIHFSLAQAYRAVGRAAEAKEEMQTFSKLDASVRESG